MLQLPNRRIAFIEHLKSLGLPIVGARGEGPGCTAFFDGTPTNQQLALVQAEAVAFDWSQGAAATFELQQRRATAKQLLATSNEPMFVAIRAVFKAIGASLREVRQAQGKPSKNDAEFMAAVAAAIDAGTGEV